MLSILIPIYNFEVTSLVEALHKQGTALDFPFEILLLDDCSSQTFHAINQLLTGLEWVSYKRLAKNIGRAQIRNALAKQAKYDYLLFMDCDSQLTSAQYLTKYVEKLSPDLLLYGGRVYQNEIPIAPQFKLHWLSGKAREEKRAVQRNLKPWDSFMTNNYIIPKAIQLQFPFEDQLQQYGHEDTLFGLQLKAAGIQIKHLDNPLKHIGLERAVDFLVKTEKAIENLVFLADRYPEMDTKLLRTAERLKRIKATALFLKLFQKRKEKWEQYLLSNRPDLTYFDLWKLGMFLLIQKSGK